MNNEKLIDELLSYTANQSGPMVNLLCRAAKALGRQPVSDKGNAFALATTSAISGVVLTISLAPVFSCLNSMPASDMSASLIFRTSPTPDELRQDVCQLNGEIEALKAQVNALVEVLESAIDCGMVPSSTAKDGGATRHARQVIVADMIREALAAHRAAQGE